MPFLSLGIPNFNIDFSCRSINFQPLVTEVKVSARDQGGQAVRHGEVHGGVLRGRGGRHQVSLQDPGVCEGGGAGHPYGEMGREPLVRGETVV